MSLKINPDVAVHYLKLIGEQQPNALYNIPDDDGVIQRVFIGSIKEAANKSKVEYEAKRLKEIKSSINSTLRFEISNLEQTLSSLYGTKEQLDETIKSLESSIRELKLKRINKIK